MDFGICSTDSKQVIGCCLDFRKAYRESEGREGGWEGREGVREGRRGGREGGRGGEGGRERGRDTHSANPGRQRTSRH